MFKFLLKAVVFYSVGLVVADVVRPVIQAIDDEA